MELTDDRTADEHSTVDDLDSVLSFDRLDLGDSIFLGSFHVERLKRDFRLEGNGAEVRLSLWHPEFLIGESQSDSHVASPGSERSPRSISLI